MARHGENIRKRSDGRWEGRYIKGRSADGKPCWGYVYGATYAEVREISARKRQSTAFITWTAPILLFGNFRAMVVFCPAWCKRIDFFTLSVYFATLSPTCFRGFQSECFKRKILEQGLLAVITPANGKQKPLGATMAQECLSMLRRICKYAAHFHLIRPLEITVKLPQNPQNTAAVYNRRTKEITVVRNGCTYAPENRSTAWFSVRAAYRRDLRTEMGRFWFIGRNRDDSADSNTDLLWKWPHKSRCSISQDPKFPSWDSPS